MLGVGIIRRDSCVVNYSLWSCAGWLVRRYVRAPPARRMNLQPARHNAWALKPASGPKRSARRGALWVHRTVELGCALRPRRLSSANDHGSLTTRSWPSPARPRGSARRPRSRAREAGAAVALAARRAERIEELARADRRRGRPRDRGADRRRRGGAGARVRAARPRRAGPARRARQQRRRDAARPDRGRAHRGVAADDPRQRLRRPLLHARRAAADARAGLGPHRQRQLGRRTRRARRRRASTTSRSSASARSRSRCARRACRSASA